MIKNKQLVENAAVFIINGIELIAYTPF